jgi:hypothetical protein
MIAAPASGSAAAGFPPGTTLNSVARAGAAAFAAGAAPAQLMSSAVRLMAFGRFFRLMLRQPV